MKTLLGCLGCFLLGTVLTLVPPASGSSQPRYQNRMVRVCDGAILVDPHAVIAVELLHPNGGASIYLSSGNTIWTKHHTYSQVVRELRLP